MLFHDVIGCCRCSLLTSHPRSPPLQGVRATTACLHAAANPAPPTPAAITWSGPVSASPSGSPNGVDDLVRALWLPVKWMFEALGVEP